MLPGHLLVIDLFAWPYDPLISREQSSKLSCFNPALMFGSSLAHTCRLELLRYHVLQKHLVFVVLRLLPASWVPCRVETMRLVLVILLVKDVEFINTRSLELEGLLQLVNLGDLEDSQVGFLVKL